MHGHQPFEHFNPDGDPSLLILCDHATNIVPDSVNGGTLGLPPDEMDRHIAHDVGARGLSLELAALLDAPALLTRFSRLVIDPNRGEDDPTLVMRLYDGTIVPANRRITDADIQSRLDSFHRPYHEAVSAQIDRMSADRAAPALISVHSYTPQLRDRPSRPWHVGVLWLHDGRIARPLLRHLRAEPDLCVGENQPYDGQLEGDTLSRHGTRRGLRHVLIEMRHDLIDTVDGQRLWAERLAPMLRASVDETVSKEMADG